MSKAIAESGEKRGILLLAHGTPETLDQIPEYLSNVTGGRALPETVVEEIRHRYSLIGASPLTVLTLEQGRLLQETLGLPVYVGMRNWHPYIAGAVARMRADGIASAVAICLAPQNSRTSVGLYRRVTFSEASGAMQIDFVEGWADHPKLAQAFAAHLAPAWQEASQLAGAPVPVLFTAHSVPCRTVQTPQAGAPRPENPQHAHSIAPDPYAIEAKRTAAKVAALLAPDGLREDHWFFAFQSQGMSGGPWIGPTVEDTLSALRRQGHTSVVIQPIGFLCDHVEILYDIDIGFREFGAKIGLAVSRPPSLNGSPLLIEALADLALRGFERLETGASTPESSILSSPAR